MIKSIGNKISNLIHYWEGTLGIPNLGISDRVLTEQTVRALRYLQSIEPESDTIE